MFINKVVIITDGVNGIGKYIKEKFLKQNAIVKIIDIAPGNHYVEDISGKNVLGNFRLDKASLINKENICIDDGMTRKRIYHNDFDWKYEGW